MSGGHKGKSSGMDLPNLATSGRYEGDIWDVLYCRFLVFSLEHLPVDVRLAELEDRGMEHHTNGSIDWIRVNEDYGGSRGNKMVGGGSGPGAPAIDGGTRGF